MSNPLQLAPHPRQEMPLFGRLRWPQLHALTVSGHTTAPLVPAEGGQILILFWLDKILSALVGKYHIKDCKQQGLMLHQFVECPVLTQLTRKIAELPSPDLAMRCRQGRDHFRRLCRRTHRLRGLGRRPSLSLRGNPPEAPPRRAA